jgi:hypothetical protein
MKSILLCFVLVSIIMPSCREIFFNEEEGTRELILEDFHAVKVSGIFNIVLIQDSTDRLVINGKNDISSVEAFVENDTLVIDDHKKMSFNPNKNTITLHFSSLEYLETIKSVSITNIDTIRADQFTYCGAGEIAEVRLVIKCNNIQILNNSNTLGYLHFIGKAENSWIWNRYGSVMNAESLFCRNAIIYNESVGDVSISASENLDVFVRASGNIYYRGNPIINILEKKGDGRIIRLE